MLRFYVTGKNQPSQFNHEGDAVVIGRLKFGDVTRVIEDPYMSRQQMSIRELPGNAIRVKNLSDNVPVKKTDGSEILPRQSCDLPLPTRLSVGMSLFEITTEAEDEVPASLLSIGKPAAGFSAREVTLLGSLERSPSPDQLVRWFETVIAVQRAAAGSADFYNEIARAMVELIGLDCGLFLLRKIDAWKVLATCSSREDAQVGYSRKVLERVCAERQTLYQPSAAPSSSASLAGVATVVASPLLDGAKGEVVGVLYGVRLLGNSPDRSEIRPLHAQLLQLLAGMATAGLARQNQEAEAARLQGQFHQFFGREMAGELARNPKLLDGKETRVTILSSDVRRFSTISKWLGPGLTCELMGDLLECMTAQIIRHGGVVVDYAGDGILAMWNAPVEQPDHAARACRAAIGMLGELPGLNTRWSSKVANKGTGERMAIAIGIGINSGEALVGNTGSRQRLKYGPIGETVNLASRVEGATKALGVPILITGQTFETIRERLATRRLAKVRLVGIENPVDLYELRGESASDEWASRRDTYERALKHFEARELTEACRTLLPLLQQSPGGGHDKPSLTLAARAIDGLRTGTFDPIITLESK